MKKEGLFLSFEGGEGCGKSTQIQLLAGRLRELGREVLLTREPGGTPVGEEIRHILQHSEQAHDLVPEAELLLFAASRSQLVRRVIEPALARGQIVLSDRFLDSTTVYQGVARQLDSATVELINRFAVADRLPDLTIYLRVEPAIAQARQAERERQQPGRPADRMESQPLAFHAAVDEGYRKLAEREPERLQTISGEGTPTEVFEKICQLLRRKFYGLFGD